MGAQQLDKVRSKALSKYTIAVLLLLGASYLSFLLLDWTDAHPVRVSDTIKFISICLCFVLALSTGSKRTNKRTYNLTLLALIFTVTADFFLLFTDHFSLGIAVFCIAHLAYITRFKAEIWKQCSGFYLLSMLLVIAVELPWPRFYSVAAVYACLIFIVSWTSRKNRLAFIGMLFFLACDVNVMLYNVLPRQNPLYEISMFAMWLFYLPAQVLLALSAASDV